MVVSVNKIKTLIKASIVSLMFVFVCSISCYAAEYTLCNGKEFNKRVMEFLNDGDTNRNRDFSITLFHKGDNPPDDPTYYVDVSEDSDGSVIVYKKENELCWYSDDFVKFPKNAAYMFENFMNLRNCDLKGFTFLNGISDARYMFANCRRLTRFSFGAPPPKEERFELSEVQGMFFNCQSIQNVDLTKFGFLHVENMTEMFNRCFNLRNIYVSKSGWKLENLTRCDNIFSECHSLRTNNGKKAVDIEPDDYIEYLSVGSDSIEGFIKDSETTYSDYGETLETIPIEDREYIDIQYETTITQVDEPDENDGEGGEGAEYGEGESKGSLEIIEGSAVAKDSESVEGSASAKNAESLDISESAESKETIPSYYTDDSIRESILKEIQDEHDETTEVEPEEPSKQIIEIENDIVEKGQKGKKGGIFDYDTDHYRFIMFAFVILVIVVLLLVGMVVYLFKEAKPKNKEKQPKEQKPQKVQQQKKQKPQGEQ